MDLQGTESHNKIRGWDRSAEDEASRRGRKMKGRGRKMKGPSFAETSRVGAEVTGMKIKDEVPGAENNR